MDAGSDGWLSTGATTTSSTIMPRAKPPVKHIPTAPTPGPPHRMCSSRARARNQPMIGLAQNMIDQLNSTTLMSLPLFVMAAAFMRRGGVAQALVDHLLA